MNRPCCAFSVLSSQVKALFHNTARAALYAGLGGEVAKFEIDDLVAIGLARIGHRDAVKAIVGADHTKAQQQIRLLAVPFLQPYPGNS
jgi:hypothetical protein